MLLFCTSFLYPHCDFVCVRKMYSPVCRCRGQSNTLTKNAVKVNYPTKTNEQKYECQDLEPPEMTPVWMKQGAAQPSVCTAFVSNVCALNVYIYLLTVLYHVVRKKTNLLPKIEPAECVKSFVRFLVCVKKEPTRFHLVPLSVDSALVAVVGKVVFYLFIFVEKNKTKQRLRKRPKTM